MILAMKKAASVYVITLDSPLPVKILFHIFIHVQKDAQIYKHVHVLI